MVTIEFSRIYGPQKKWDGAGNFNWTEKDFCLAEIFSWFNNNWEVKLRKKCLQVAEMRGDIEELERRRTAEHREVAKNRNVDKYSQVRAQIGCCANIYLKPD